MNKYRRLFYLAMMLILASCSDQTTYSLDGDWIGYKAVRAFSGDTIQDNFHLLLTFQGDSLYVRNFKYIRGGDKDSLSIYSYRIQGDSLISIDQENVYSFEIIEQARDELVLSTGRTELYYRRLDGTTPKIAPVELAKNTYTISRYGEVIDTAKFWDDQTVEMYNRALERPHEAFYYAIKNFAGHDLLVVDSPELPVFMIRETGEGIFELKKEPRDTAGFMMQKVR